MVPFFWISLFIVFYTFIGYGILLFLIIVLRRRLSAPRPALADGYAPSLTIVVAAYNEEGIIEAKIANTFALSYPRHKINYVFVTDGSADRTPLLVARHAPIHLVHSPDRKGKIDAVHRAMSHVHTDIVVFTDANTFLNRDALYKIARHYADPAVGAVSGEKRVNVTEVSDATAGEGFYWKYESVLKKWDSELYSVVGAAGELFSIRTALYQPVPSDTILDDFMISMRIAARGYKIRYEPEAYAIEDASADTTEELKRKVRIAAGGIQSIVRLTALLHPFRHPVLSFQYISHRVLRWTVTPFFMVLALLANAGIVLRQPTWCYQALLAAQALFYTLALVGWLLERRAIRIKTLFVPYYFCMMNFAIILGIHRYFSGKQNAAWEKARRKV